MNHLLLSILIIFSKFFFNNCQYYYELIRTNDFEAELDWSNQSTPCSGDIIHFVKNSTNLFTISESFKISSMDLPNNGVIYFGENLKIGRKGGWQCMKKDKPQHKYFNVSSRGNPNFFDQSHWRIKNNELSDSYMDSETLLHFQRVPDSLSIAAIPYGNNVQFEAKNTIHIQKYIKHYQVNFSY
uniref:Protein amnionless n=1 Tax=Parastrongyloides trichosuri TaxID=131310 RepID=A0A0N4ZWC2_PARTI